MLGAALALFAAPGGVSAQPASDCAKAKTATEKAICATPELAAADAAMSTAYTALAKTLPPAQQTGLQANQRRWLKERDTACMEGKGDAPTGCLLAETLKRRRFLSGQGANGAAGAPPLLPAFYNEMRKGAYEISAAYPQFAPPVGARFDRVVRDLTIGQSTLAEYRQDKPNEFNGSSNFYQVSYDLSYLAPRLAAVTFQFADYRGGAHPNSWRASVLWNPASDEKVTLGEILGDPKAAVPAISALCNGKLSVEAKEEGWRLFDNADFAAVVGDAKSWSVGADGVAVMFDPYSVAAYVVGPRDCRLTYAELKPWLKPGGVLPPGAGH
jgi:uncharacterized protein YecT (DUF1311 family)